MRHDGALFLESPEAPHAGQFSIIHAQSQDTGLVLAGELRSFDFQLLHPDAVSTMIASDKASLLRFTYYLSKCLESLQ